jgi:hypothetical protein
VILWLMGWFCIWAWVRHWSCSRENSMPSGVAYSGAWQLRDGNLVMLERVQPRSRCRGRVAK